MKASQNCIDLIKSSEALHLKAYLCPARKLTIGYGHVLLPSEVFREITEAQAYQLLVKDISIAENCINRAVKVTLNQNQFDALTDFVFNLGCVQFLNSTLLKLLNSGKYTAAAEQFTRWVYCNGGILDGLVTRRNKEKELFLKAA